jgi:TRAP-type uncharacterized transport system fused permease subunit
MLADQFSSTGEFYQRLAGTQPTSSSIVTVVTSSMTESTRKVLGFTVFAIVVGIIIGLVALIGFDDANCMRINVESGWLCSTKCSVCGDSRLYEKP